MKKEQRQHSFPCINPLRGKNGFLGLWYSSSIIYYFSGFVVNSHHDILIIYVICPFFSKIISFVIPCMIFDQNHLFRPEKNSFLSLDCLCFYHFLHNNHCIIQYGTCVGIRKMFCMSGVVFFIVSRHQKINKNLGSP